MRLVPWIPPLFRDRAAAGRALSEAVAALQLDEPVVVGVARGGVAVEIARELQEFWKLFRLGLALRGELLEALSRANAPA